MNSKFRGLLNLKCIGSSRSSSKKFLLAADRDHLRKPHWLKFRDSWLYETCLRLIHLQQNLTPKAHESIEEEGVERVWVILTNIFQFLRSLNLLLLSKISFIRVSTQSGRGRVKAHMWKPEGNFVVFLPLIWNSELELRLSGFHELNHLTNPRSSFLSSHLYIFINWWNNLLAQRCG
jgi:hypothetical protein